MTDDSYKDEAYWAAVEKNAAMLRKRLTPEKLRRVAFIMGVELVEKGDLDVTE